ncbi:MAG: amino acid permease, partial [Chlamydiota bacterium]|nr:amino acid permease [Chlamydiota bacterium]
MNLPSKRTLSTFALAMFNVSIMASLRNLPMNAQLGYSLPWFFCLLGFCFLMPCSLVSAELATGWSQKGGIYIWVKEAFGDRWGLLAIWMQWAHNFTWYPAILSFAATTVSYLIKSPLTEHPLYLPIAVPLTFWIITLLNCLGIKVSSWISTLGAILGTIIPGILLIGLSILWIANDRPLTIPLSLHSFIPHINNRDHLVLMVGMFLSFGGLEVSAGYANRVKNPQRHYPRAIWIATVITFCLLSVGGLAVAIVIKPINIDLVSGLMETFHHYLSPYSLTWLLPTLGGFIAFGAIAEINSWVIGPVHSLHTTGIHGNIPPLLQ